MDPFRLTEEAVFDIDAIWLHLLEKDGVETADRIVTELFKAFYKLSEIPNAAHRRADLTNKQVLFYRVLSYLIIYEPGTQPLEILGVLHGKRDISRILRQRL